jgi:putative transposase
MARQDDAPQLPEMLATAGGEGLKDLLRDVVRDALQELIEEELTATIGAAKHERTDTRTGQRNGGRDRLVATPAGDVEVRIPKLRQGASSRRVAARAAPAGRPGAVGGNHGRLHHRHLDEEIDDLLRALGCDSGVSKSPVSRICAEIDEQVAVLCERRLDHTGFPYVFLDATYVKARIDHQVVSRAVVIATGVTADGDREVLGVDVGDSEDELFWTGFLRSLKGRGLAGVKLVVSDAHAGLKPPPRGCCRTRLGRDAGSI